MMLFFSVNELVIGKPENLDMRDLLEVITKPSQSFPPFLRLCVRVGYAACQILQ